MSKVSPKQRYTQLTEWLKTTNFGPKKGPKRFSKSDHYKKTRDRYGKKSN